MSVELIRVLVNGAYGKMGQVSCEAVDADPRLQLVGAVGRGDDLDAEIRTTQAQVVVDFTTPQSVFKHALVILEAGAHPVIGTTGLQADQVETIRQRCEQLKRGALIAPNFSLGALLMMRFSEQAAAYFPDAEIIERHHPFKLDAPSGTALATAKRINAARRRAVTPTDTMHAARGDQVQGCPIHAVRLPGHVAHQSVIFGGDCETLTISHDSLDRKSFMPGICLACVSICETDLLIEGLEHLI